MFNTFQKVGLWIVLGPVLLFALVVSGFSSEFLGLMLVDLLLGFPVLGVIIFIGVCLLIYGSWLQIVSTEIDISVGKSKNRFRKGFAVLFLCLGLILLFPFLYLIF